VFVLDTNVISELMRPRPDPAVSGWLAAHGGSRVSITSISRAEIRYGIARLDTGERRDDLTARADATFAEIGSATLDFDAAAADRYGALVAERERIGRPISVLDGQIAAIALANGADVVTRNARDFDDCGLKVHNPWSPLPPRPRA